MNPTQAILPGFEAFSSRPRPAKNGLPDRTSSNKSSSTFWDTPLTTARFGTGESIKLTKLVFRSSTYARYLAYLIKTGWMRTLKRLPRVAIREIVLSSQAVQNQSTGTSSETSPPINQRSSEVSRETLAPETLPERIRNVLKRAWGRIKRAKNPAAYRQSIISCETRLMARENQMLHLSEFAPEMRRGIENPRPIQQPQPEPPVELDEEMKEFLESGCSTLAQFRSSQA